MRFTGKLHTWNPDRGFGFIRPTDGGQDIFVHISSLPGGRKPADDEALSFEVSVDREGRKKAVNLRLASVEQAGLAADLQRGRAPTAAPAGRADDGERGLLPRGSGVRMAVIALVALSAFSFYGYRQRGAPVASSAPVAPAALQRAAAPAFRCDGRQHCSQMASCEEAEYFLKHCPDVKMDGDHDGKPCELDVCKSRHW